YRNEFTIRISSCGSIRKITSVVYISYNGGSGKTFMCPFMHRAGVLKSKCTGFCFNRGVVFAEEKWQSTDCHYN
ncbi:MAG TPA: hypothetical protein VEZ55_15250, partial [Chitinophagaceae bacterium]|nr:hypothetical protein [Chitinophagaceae bacterium]